MLPLPFLRTGRGAGAPEGSAAPAPAVARGAGKGVGGRLRIAAAAALLPLTACLPRTELPARPDPLTLPSGSPLLSSTLDAGDAWLRHNLMFGDHQAALRLLGRGRTPAASDRLLRALQQGVVLHHAGELARSNQLLGWAEVQAELRYTRSLSRAAGALLVNDRMLAYTPSAVELGLVSYYRMLNYLALGDTAGALVESRRANARLARDEHPSRARCRVDGLVQYLAGVVQRAGGELDDALISLRQAERAFAGCGAEQAGTAALVAVDLYHTARAADAPEVADSVARRYRLAPDTAARGTGEVLVVLEQGFVAHRTAESLHLPIVPQEVEGLESDDADGIAAAAARIGERLMHGLAERSAWGGSMIDHPAGQLAYALEGAHVLRFAWPALRMEGSRPAAARVLAGGTAVEVAAAGDLSAAARDQLEALRPALVTRMVARGLARYLVSRGVEKEAEERGGELAAFVAGRIANAAANRLEQADVRSWSLLPDRISLARVRLPPGTHRLRLEVRDAEGTASVRELGEVEVRAGETRVVSERVWDAEGGEPLRPAPARAASAGRAGG